MPQVSRHPLNKDTYKKIYNIFLESFSSNQTKKDLDVFLEELLTPTEKIMLSKRLLIAYLLEKKFNYREISSILHVSTSTVNRVDASYRNSKQIKIVLKKLLKKKNIEEFLLSIGITFTSLLAVDNSKTKVWKNVNRELIKKSKDNL